MFHKSKNKLSFDGSKLHQQYFLVFSVFMSQQTSFSSHSFSPQLIEGIKAGEKQGLSIFYDRCAAALFGIIFGILKTDDLAEKALKNTFVSIRIGIMAGECTSDNICGWMMRIARSEAAKLCAKPSSGKIIDIGSNPTALSIALLGQYSLSEVAEKLCLTEVETKKAIREELKNANGQKG